MANTSIVLVVGATGNVGSILVPLLQAAGVQVRALVRDEAKAQPLRDQGVQVVFGDLDQPETLDAAVEGADKVYLITWNGPTGATHGNNLITAAKRTGRPHIVKQGVTARPAVGSSSTTGRWSTSCVHPACHTRCCGRRSSCKTR